MEGKWLRTVIGLVALLGLGSFAFLQLRERSPAPSQLKTTVLSQLQATLGSLASLIDFQDITVRVTVDDEHGRSMTVSGEQDELLAKSWTTSKGELTVKQISNSKASPDLAGNARILEVIAMVPSEKQCLERLEASKGFMFSGRTDSVRIQLPRGGTWLEEKLDAPRQIGSRGGSIHATDNDLDGRWELTFHGDR